MGNRIIQYMAMLSTTFISLGSGINLGWTSQYLPQLLAPGSPIPTTNTEASWCAVMPLLGAPFGALLAAVLVDRIGCKNFLLTQAPLMSACFISMAFARSILVLSIARLVIGSIEGAIYTALPIYLGEIADPEIRGKLGSSIAIAALVGMLFINIVGAYETIFVSSLICACVPVINFMTFVWMPESPYYLLRKGMKADAERSLQRFRGRKDVHTEFEEIAEAVVRQDACVESSYADLFKVKSYRKAFVISMILSFSNKFSGISPVIFNTATIFVEAGGMVDPLVSVIAFHCAGVIGTVLAIVLVDRYGRRPLMLFSASGCALTLAAQGAYFSGFLEWGWLPVVAMMAYNLIFSLGLLFGPVLFLGEIFPTSVKAKALAIADTISIMFGTIASKFFHAVTENGSMAAPFWCFAACVALGCTLIYFKVPETKGKSLEVIQLELLGVKQLTGVKEAKE